MPRFSLRILIAAGASGDIEAIDVKGYIITGIQCDVGNLADLGRLFEAVEMDKGRFDIPFASQALGSWLYLSLPRLRSTSMTPST